MLTDLSVANLHAFTVKTRTLCESFYDECSLSFCTFHDKVEPTWHSIGVRLSFQLYLIGILSCESDCEYVAAFKIAAKGNRTNGYNLADTALNLLDTFIDLLPIEILQLSLCVSFYQLKPVLLTIAHFAILPTKAQHRRKLLRKRISQNLILYFLKLLLMFLLTLHLLLYYSNNVKYKMTD